jgi:hypothetical protein
MRIPMLLACACLTSASIANAQPGASPEPPPMGPPSEAPSEVPPPSPEPPTPTPTPTPTPAEPPVPTPSVDKGVLDDANSGRGWLIPTALTPPAGTWSFSDFELLIIGAGYSFTDRFQVSLTTVLPITNDFPIVGMLNGKYQFLKTGRLRAAVQAAGLFATSRESEEGSDTFTAANLGGVLTLCIDRDCHSHATGYVGTGIAAADQAALPLLFGASVALKAARHVKFVLEVDSAALIGDINETADGALFWYGARFTSKLIGVDLGFVQPIYDGSDGELDSELPLGIPFVSFTYRGIE